MKKLIIAAFLSTPFASQADIIRCTFTEPFVSLTYSMTQSRLTLENHSTGRTSVTRNVSFQILGAGRFELWNSSRRVLAQLNLNFRGSDGMSDRVYPYSVRRSGGQRGGCTSNYLHAR